MMDLSANQQTARALDIVRRLEEAGALGNGGRLPALLRYLVSEELAGRGERLKAYSIATQVLGRSQGFNPAEDAIVRVEIARLRRALDYYYATKGRHDHGRISIPRGGSRPLIEFDTEITPRYLPDTAENSGAHGVQTRTRIKLLYLLGAFALVLGTVLSFLLGGEDARTEAATESTIPAYSSATPRLVLLPILGQDAETRRLALGLRAQLAALVSQQRWLAVTVEDEFVPASPVPPKLFTLSAVLQRDEKGYALRAMLHHHAENRLVWSAVYTGPMLHEPAVSLAQGLAADIARDLGYPLGPVGQAVAARSGETAADVEDRFLCMMNANRYWRGLEAKQREDSLACLNRLAMQSADFADGRAMLALFALEDARAASGDERTAALARAEQLLRGAPAGERLPLVARMTLNACRGDAAAVREDATQLFSLAPNDPDTLAEIANAAGLAALAWPTALSAEDRALALSSVVHPRYAHARAAKLLLDGDYEEALAALSRVPQGKLPLGQTMMLALATLADAPLRAQSAADALAEPLSKDPQMLFAAIDGACWAPEVKDAFRKALTRALSLRTAR